eukprot:5713439-Prymnesium_polylepis.1
MPGASMGSARRRRRRLRAWTASAPRQRIPHGWMASTPLPRRTLRASTCSVRHLQTILRAWTASARHM